MTTLREPNQYSCRLCQERGKDWKGDDPKCAFGHGLSFSRENWNCATMAVFRDACREDFVCTDEQNVGVVSIEALEGDHNLTHLVLSWYKSRGRTDNAILLDSNGLVFPLTARLAESIALSLKAKRQ